MIFISRYLRPVPAILPANNGTFWPSLAYGLIKDNNNSRAEQQQQEEAREQQNNNNNPMGAQRVLSLNCKTLDSTAAAELSLCIHRGYQRKLLDF